MAECMGAEAAFVPEGRSIPTAVYPTLAHGQQQALARSTAGRFRPAVALQPDDAASGPGEVATAAAVSGAPGEVTTAAATTCCSSTGARRKLRQSTCLVGVRLLRQHWQLLTVTPLTLARKAPLPPSLP
jgi:hypothetical protein